MPDDHSETQVAAAASVVRSADFVVCSAAFWACSAPPTMLASCFVMKAVKIGLTMGMSDLINERKNPPEGFPAVASFPLPSFVKRIDVNLLLPRGQHRDESTRDKRTGEPRADVMPKRGFHPSAHVRLVTDLPGMERHPGAGARQLGDQFVLTTLSVCERVALLV